MGMLDLFNTRAAVPVLVCILLGCTGLLSSWGCKMMHGLSVNCEQ